MQKHPIKHSPLQSQQQKHQKRCENRRSLGKKQKAKNKEITDFSFERLVKLPLNKK